VHVYPVPPCAASSFTGEGEVPGGGSLMVAVRVPDLVSPLRNGAPLAAGDRSALVIGGTARIRTGEPVVFCKVVAVAPAQVRRDGRIQAQGSPAEHATLGPLEDWLEAKAGPGVIDGIAGKAVLAERFVKGERKRLLAAAFMIRVIVLMTLMVRHEALCDRTGVKGPRRLAVAAAGVKLEEARSGVAGRVGAASTKSRRPGTAGSAGCGERSGKVYERNRWSYVSSVITSSNPADTGWGAVRTFVLHDGRRELLSGSHQPGMGGHGENAAG
jgi:hypothetical protein